jgi:hypothetical protein
MDPSSSKHLVTTKQQDYLQQDPPLRGQNYVCLSFVSPEDVIQKKEHAFFSEFLKGFASDMTVMFDSLTAKFRDQAQVVDMLNGVRKVHDHIFDPVALKSQYDHFVSQNVDRLEREYYESNGFQTCVRGIKVRGTYETLHDAKQRASAIQKFDSLHNVYVAEVGCWCPWSPKPADIEQQEYMETQLNTLVKGYQHSREEASSFFEQQQREAVASASLASTVPVFDRE